MIEGYDIAQICANGHATNASTRSMPQFNQDYCDKCGANTFTACPACNTPIRGEYYTPGVIGISCYEPPAFCYKCGKPFPWTEGRMNAAVELIQNEVSAEDAKTFKTSIDDIVRDTPRTQVGVGKFKKIIGKVGKETASAVRDILVDIASETAKKAIWGGGD